MAANPLDELSHLMTGGQSGVPTPSKPIIGPRAPTQGRGFNRMASAARSSALRGQTKAVPGHGGGPVGGGT